ncbi:MAG: SpoIID/LytB domain-containing protein [Lachnospiraceae bacterium]|nr:SpoIID/LytB domain-containing protein [Lachnospiraceae bacterium]
MKYHRIVLKKTNKRDAGGFLLFVFLLPYVCASLWGHVGEETEKLRQREGVPQAQEAAGYEILVKYDWGVWALPLEEYLVYKLSAVMPQEYEKEALKAQAVLLRTEVVEALREEDTKSLQISGGGMERWYETDTGSEAYLPWRQAVEETAGLYLCCEGEPIQASYFKLSNGQTRDAAEVWDTDTRPYLTGISCVQDKAARDYSSIVKVSRTNYVRTLQARLTGNFSQQEILEGAAVSYDSAGYVTKVSFSAENKETQEIDGEEFRYLFDLPSASFEMEQEKTQVIFRVTGVGHGFGMSQYGANCMALNGETYDQILAEFFFRTELAKFE